MSKSKTSKHKVQRSTTEQFCSKLSLVSKSKDRNFSDRPTVTDMIWVSKGFCFFVFSFFFFFTSSASLLTLKLNPAAGTSELFPPSSAYLRVKLYVGGDGIHNYTFNTTNNPRPLPKYVCDGNSVSCRSLHKLEDISSSLHLAWSTERRPLSLQLPGAELDKSHHTQRDLKHESWRIFMRFKSVYSLFCLLENGFMWKKKRRTLCKLSKNWHRIWRGQHRLGVSGCCCRQDVPQWRFRVAVVNWAAPSLQEK